MLLLIYPCDKIYKEQWSSLLKRMTPAGINKNNKPNGKTDNISLQYDLNSKKQHTNW